MLTSPPYHINGRSYFCPIQLTVDTLAGRWKPMILWHLVLHDALRYSALKRSLVTVTHKMLAQSLRELEADGMILRRVVRVMPPEVSYSLSPRGAELRGMFARMKAFGEQFRDEPAAAPLSEVLHPSLTAM